MLKTIGAILVLSSAGLMGAGSAFELKRRIMVLQAVINALVTLKNEIHLRKLPVPEILQEIRTGEESVDKAFHAAANFQDGGTLSASWRQSFLDGPEELDLEERRLLLSMGEILGRYEEQEQASQADFVISSLRQRLEEKRKKQRQEGKMRLFTGMAAGVFLVIILL